MNEKTIDQKELTELLVIAIEELSTEDLVNIALGKKLKHSKLKEL